MVSLQVPAEHLEQIGWHLEWGIVSTCLNSPETSYCINVLHMLPNESTGDHHLK